MDERTPTAPSTVRQLRLVVEASDFEEAVAFYRDALGLDVELDLQSDGGAHVVILQAGRATGLDEHGAAKGYFEACGVRPRILDRLRERGAELPESLFQRRQLVSWSAHHAGQANRAGGNGQGGAHGHR